MSVIDAGVPGGRFPSDLRVPQDVNRNDSPSSDGSNNAGVIAAAGAVSGSTQDEYLRNGQNPYRLDGVSAGTRPSTAYEGEGSRGSYLAQTPSPTQQRDVYAASQQQGSYAAGPSQQAAYSEPQQQFSQQTQAPLAATSEPVQQPTKTYTPAQQDQSFLGLESVPAPAPPSRHESLYGDWMAPAAAGVAGAGAGAAGYAAYQQRQEDPAPVQQQETSMSRDAPRTYQPSGYAGAPAASGSTNTGAFYVEDTPAAFNPTNAPSASAAPATIPAAVDATPAALSTSDTAHPATTTSMPPPGETTTLGGLESEGAHETGAIFPKILRHDTDISVSNLHIPGKFPKGV